MRKHIIILTCLLLIIISIPFLIKTNEELPQQKNEWVTQTCQMCGLKWEVLSLDNNKTIPKTVEWCFKDGVYCEAGFEIMVNGFKSEDKGKYELDFLNHCLVCQGCRCASFKPKEWHEIVNKIEQIRKNK